jgi:hypothetical protein
MVISHGFTLALLIFLLLVVAPFGASIGSLRFLVLALPFVLVTAKNGTDHLLADGVVGDDVH